MAAHILEVIKYYGWIYIKGSSSLIGALSLLVDYILKGVYM